ncbi:MAG: UDP-N-acetylglucosamine 1-carboxyvinyltransferase [Dethiobacteria bacterium]|jgi:UDP-N-acetylglucosamine 1-carboxyvinyltransferase
MQKLLINGKQVLGGSISISGAKNAAVAILPAAILAGEKVAISNMPSITDTNLLLEILKALGAKVQKEGKNIVKIDPAGVNSTSPPFEMVKKMRASYYFMGSLVARFGRAEIPLPGGCNLGPRPIDQHLKGFSALGAEINQEHGTVTVKGKKLKGAHIYLDVVSVGATINIMLAATTAEGRTIIENAAKEPEIVDTANFLNALGAKIRGAGTDVIKIDGVKELGGAEHCIIPDRIEAGTFMFAAAATRGELTICDIIPKHLDPVIAKLREIGIQVDVGEESLHVCGQDSLSPVDIKTFPYPGFPTDLQPLAMVLLSTIPGTSLIKENVFDGRFKHVDELKRMGAKIKVEGRTAVIEGVEGFTGAPVKATDLRAGAALLVAGLIAEGETRLSGVEHIRRGYENIEKKFAQAGVELKCVER